MFSVADIFLKSNRHIRLKLGRKKDWNNYQLLYVLITVYAEDVQKYCAETEELIIVLCGKDKI